MDEPPPPPELPEEIPATASTDVTPVPPVPLPAQISDRWKGVYWAPSTYLRGHLFIHGLVFLMMAASLAFQPERYTMDTLQGLYFLMQWLAPWQWAVAFTLAAVLKIAAGFAYPRLSRSAIALGSILISVWAAGFAFAWMFDHATAIGFGAFILLLGEHFAATTLLDGRRHWTRTGPE